MGDHVYEPVTPAASTDRTSSPVKQTGPSPKDDNRHFLRIPLTEELVMADDVSSEPDAEGQKSEEYEDDDEEDEEEDEEDEEEEEENHSNNVRKIPRSDELIYEGENENSSVGEGDNGSTRIKMFQQKVKVKADILRSKLQGVTKRKAKQKIVVDTPNSEKSRRKFGQFATLPKKFTFNAPKVNFSTAFGNFRRNATHSNQSGSTDETKSGRFSLSRFGFSKTSSESPKPSKSTKIGSSRLSIPSLRTRTWSDASKVSKPGSPKPKLMDFGTYPRIFSKRKKADDYEASKSKMTSTSNNDNTELNKRKDSFRRRFFRSNKESTPAPTGEQTATLAVEEELDETHMSKESLAEFGDSDLQEVISLSDECRSKDTKSLSDHRSGVIEEIDSDEFFLREKGLSRGNVHISNYLSSEIRDMFRSNRTRSVEGVNNNNNTRISNNNKDDNKGTATPIRPSRTNSLKRPIHSQNICNVNTSPTDRFSTMPKSFGGTKSFVKPEDYTPENIITSQTFEPSQNSTFVAPWRKAQKENIVAHMPPKPPIRHQMSKFSTFDTRSMIDLSRKRSQSQSGFMPSMNFIETVPKAPLRRSRTSLAGSERDISVTSDSRPSWATSSGVPTPPLRRSRMSLTADTDVEERSAPLTNGGMTVKSSATPPRPPPPTVGYATVDKSQSISLLMPPQSPMRHRRKKSYDVIKSQEFGVFFTIPRSYSYHKRLNEEPTVTISPPSRPARAYNTLGPSRPLRRRLPTREHEYGDVVDDGGGSTTPEVESESKERNNEMTSSRLSMTARSSSMEDTRDGPVKVLYSGDVIEKMKLRPLPSPPAPPRKTKITEDNPELHRRRYTDSSLVPFLGQREMSVTSSDDYFADISHALQASAAKIIVDDVSIGVQTDPLPDGYELDDLGSCCSAESDRPTSRASSTAASAAINRPVTKTLTTATVDRPTSRTSMTTEYVERSTSRISNTAIEDGYVMMPKAATGVICAQRISVNELQVGKITVSDICSQRLAVDDMSGSDLKMAHLAAGSIMPLSETAAVFPPCDLHHQDDTLSVESSRVSSMYPEVDSDEDRTSVMAVPTPPRRRSKPAAGAKRSGSNDNYGGKSVNNTTTVDMSAAATDPSITELSCQLFRLCHSNVCSLFNKVVQQVVPEDTEKRRDLQAALCFLSIILAGLLILGFGNEKTIHHHHWDFQFPPPNQ